MELSRHYTNDRIERENAIKEIGLGEVVYTTKVFDEKRNKFFIYEISSTAILTVKATDREDFVVTRYPARPSRLKKYWENVTEQILELSILHTRMGLVF